MIRERTLELGAGCVPARSGRLVPAECAPELRPVAIDLFDSGYADYHALHRSLTFDPTARAGIRRPSRDQPAEPDEPQAVQLDLFADAPA